MTAHQFAHQLLAPPDFIIVTPRVVEYSDNEDHGMATPYASINECEDPDTFEKIKFVMVNYKD